MRDHHCRVSSVGNECHGAAGNQWSAHGRYRYRHRCRALRASTTTRWAERTISRSTEAAQELLQIAPEARCSPGESRVLQRAAVPGRGGIRQFIDNGRAAHRERPPDRTALPTDSVVYRQRPGGPRLRSSVVVRRQHHGGLLRSDRSGRAAALEELQGLIDLTNRSPCSTFRCCTAFDEMSRAHRLPDVSVPSGSYLLFLHIVADDDAGCRVHQEDDRATSWGRVRKPERSPPLHGAGADRARAGERGTGGPIQRRPDGGRFAVRRVPGGSHGRQEDVELGGIARKPSGTPAGSSSRQGCSSVPVDVRRAPVSPHPLNSTCLPDLEDVDRFDGFHRPVDAR